MFAFQQRGQPLADSAHVPRRSTRKRFPTRVPTEKDAGVNGEAEEADTAMGCADTLPPERWLEPLVRGSPPLFFMSGNDGCPEEKHPAPADGALRRERAGEFRRHRLTPAAAKPRCSGPGMREKQVSPGHPSLSDFFGELQSSPEVVQIEI